MKEVIVLDNLDQSVDYMLSSDYKERFIAEYAQVITRFDKLFDLLCKSDEGELDFKFSCPENLLNLQLEFMHKYITILEARAIIEGIDLDAELTKMSKGGDNK